MGGFSTAAAAGGGTLPGVETNNVPGVDGLALVQEGVTDAETLMCTWVHSKQHAQVRVCVLHAKQYAQVCNMCVCVALKAACTGMCLYVCVCMCMCVYVLKMMCGRVCMSVIMRVAGKCVHLV